MFFTPDFSLDFDWQVKHALRIGSVQPRNAKQINDGLKDMSAESIRNRFLGSKKEFSQKELEYLTVLDGKNHYALGIEERNRPHRGVAIVRLVRSSEDPLEAEVAITIIDEYQRLGLGSVLLGMMALAAQERGLERLSYTFLPQNEGIVKLIHKLGASVAGAHGADYVQLFQELKNLDLARLRKNLLQHFPQLSKYSSTTT